MKLRMVVGLAVLALTLTGCKGKLDKQGQLMELSEEISEANDTIAHDCPLVNDKGQPDLGGHPNTSPKCVEDRKHEQELQKKYADLERDASK